MMQSSLASSSLNVPFITIGRDVIHDIQGIIVSNHGSRQLDVSD